MTKKNSKTKKALRIFGRILLGLFIFLFLVILFIRSPWGQRIIKDQVVSTISDKTGTKVALDKLFIRFNGNIQLDGLYLEDKSGDTLVYSKSLNASVPFWPLISGSGVSINRIEWNTLRANIIRKDSLEGFNYQFLVDAFAAEDTLNAPPADTSSAPLNLNLGDFELNDFKVVYQDDVSGIDAKLNFEELVLKLQETDMENMRFRISNAKLANSLIDYQQTKPFPEPEEEEDAPLPFINIENLKLENVRVSYVSEPDSISSNLNIADFLVEEANMDLQENNIKIDKVALYNSDVLLEMKQKESPQVAETESQDSISDAFEWPDFNISVKKIDFKNNDIAYYVNNARVKKGEFNPDALRINDLLFEANDINYEPKNAFANISKLQFKEASGLAVNKFNIDLRLTNEQFSLSNFKLNMNNNLVSANLVMDYENFDEFLNDPGEAHLKADLDRLNFDVKELYRFQPDLKNNEYIQALAKATLYGSLKAEGKLDKVNLRTLNLSWKNTSIAGSGTLSNLEDPENLRFNLPNVSVKSSREDLMNFVSEEDLGIRLPDQVSLTGNFSGTTEAIKTKSVLATSDGKILVDGNFDLGDNIKFDADIKGEKIALGNILQNEALGDIELDIDLKGGGNSVENLNATLNTTISSFTYNDYEYKDLVLEGKLENGKGPVNVTYKDDNINMQADAQIALDSIASKFDLNLNMDGINLGALGITSQKIKAGFKLEASYEGNSENFNAQAEIIDGVAVYNNKTYLLGRMDATAFVKPDTTSVKVTNQILDLNLQSNANPSALGGAINRHFKRYITENYKEDSIVKPVDMVIDARIRQAPILNEVFLVNLEDLDTVKINMDFKEKERKLNATVAVPHVNYSGSEIDSLHFNMQSDQEDLNFDFGFNALSLGPLAIKKTEITGVVLDRKLNLDFESTYKEERLVHVNSDINFQGDTLKVKLNPKDLILDKEAWDIASTNVIGYSKNYLDFNDFVLSRNTQKMELSNKKPGIEKEHLGLNFQNFKLAALLSYLNPEDELATGQLNGDFILEEPFGETGILANMEINQFKLLDVNLSTLSLDAKSTGLDNYDFKMALKGGEIDMDMDGSYVADEAAAKVDLNLDINEFKMTAAEGFSMGEIKDGGGYISGNLEVSGTTDDPQYNGQLNFNKAAFNLAMLNERFILPDEEIKLDNDGIYFDNLKINDAENNSFVVNGEVKTESFTNPGFDLNLKASNFRVLNSTEEDNELFYGTAIVDVDADITGDLNLPVVKADLKVKESTDFTYVLPDADLEVKERGGIVIFVDKENPNAILSDNKEESYVVSGLDVSARLSVEENATFNIIISKETGDKFQVQGEGDLLFEMFPNGRTSLSGVYNVNDGFYEMSLYNLVKRRFDLADGSRVSWSGDMFDANLDVRAIYNVETSAYSLMATQVAGSNESQQNRFKQEFPFLVYLNIDGELTKPKISFNIDMPEEEKGAAGGEIYGKIQQLNTQEQNLNQQVFSLLVLNRFFPGSGSDGSSGGTLSVARDNLNQALSDQLNMLSSKIMGDSGVKLNFGLDSYTDYQSGSAQDRTQLDINAQKAFLEDRLIVKVGSEVDIQGSGGRPGEEETPLIGNVSLEYLLDPDGVYRIKGFRKNQYENVIDGQLIVSGISLIFTKEFNKFKNLFEKSVLEEVAKEKDNKEEKDKNKDQANEN